MSTYETLKGLKVKFLSADTSGSRLQEGELFYNSSDFNLKSHVAVEAWSSGSSLVNAKIANGNVGIQTAALSCGGFTSVPDGNPDRKTDSEEYNGVGWTAGGTMNTAKSSGVTYGTQTAALAAQGETVNSEEYNGTAWTEGNNMGTARGENGIQFGIQTAAVAAGGSPNKALVEEYDGTSWSEVNNLPAANFGGHGAGTLTAGLGFGGYTTATVGETLSYDGTNWTDVGNMNLVRRNGTANFGTASLAYVFGGITPAGNRQTTGAVYDGSAWAAASASLGLGRQHNGGIGAGGSSTTSGLACGGNVAPNNSTGATEEFNISTSTVTGAAWASGGNINTARRALWGGGTQTAGLIWGGYIGPVVENKTEEYNGTSWSEQNNLNTAGYHICGTGTQTAGLAFGRGQPPSANTEEYDGTSWSEQNNLGTARYIMAGFGIQTAAVGYGGSGSSSATEHYDGSSWTAGGNYPEAIYAGAAVGTESAGLGHGGYSAADESNTAEANEYNGTAWTAANAMVIKKSNTFTSGSQTDAINFLGASPTTAQYVVSQRYDGTSWSTSANAATARYSQAGSSTGGATGTAYAAGGFPGTANSNLTEEFTGETVVVNAAKTIDFD